MTSLSPQEQIPVYEQLKRNVAEDSLDLDFQNTLAVMGAVAVLGGAIHESKVGTTQASAAESAQESARIIKVNVPKITPDMSIPEAALALKKAGLKSGGIRPNKNGKIPKPAAGHEFVAKSWAKKNVKRVKNESGKWVNKVSYRKVRAGSDVRKGTRIYTVPRQVESKNIRIPGIVPGGDQPARIIPPVENPNPVPEFNLGAEKANYLSKHTAYVNFSRCSGLFNFDLNGAINSVTFANHCFRYTETGRDSNGQRYARVADRNVSTGDSLNTLVSRGKMTKVIVPKEGDVGSDFAVGVMEGSTVIQALETVQNKQMTTSEIDSWIASGKKMILSGWPNSQSYNTSGVLRRQSWEVTPLANNVKIKTTAGNDISALMVGVNETVDGALPTDGASGAEVVAVDVVNDVNGQQKLSDKPAGVNTGNYDLRYGERNVYGFSDEEINNIKQYYKETTGADLSGYDGVFFFAPVRPYNNPNGTPANYDVLNLVN